MRTSLVHFYMHDGAYNRPPLNHPCIGRLDDLAGLVFTRFYIWPDNCLICLVITDTFFTDGTTEHMNERLDT